MGSDGRNTVIILFNEKTPKLRESLYYSASSFLDDLIVPNSSTSDTNTAIYLGFREFSLYTITTIKNMPNAWKKTDDIKFFSGNPLNEQTEGIVHIFTKLFLFLARPFFRSPKASSKKGQSSEMLCILGIPCSITAKDILYFIAPMSKGITELKIVKCHLIGHYMALLKFKSTVDADEFYATFNGSSYNSLEPDICQMAYVSHVEAITTTSNGSCGASFPLKGLVELPSCPVCLEKLDEPVAGILTTILCNHSFHDQCISKTTDTVPDGHILSLLFGRCPVCRYVQSPEMEEDSQCADCDLRDNLWICLICGNLGCGRYGHKHAYRHFEKTGHTFALELGKNMVWDYADDAYVHRIAVNHEDGKLVQVGEGGETGDKKADGLCMEFSAVLVSQLESQRQYFESQLEVITSESAARICAIENDLQSSKTCIAEMETKLAAVMKEKNLIAHKLAQFLGVKSFSHSHVYLVLAVKKNPEAGRRPLKKYLSAFKDAKDDDQIRTAITKLICVNPQLQLPEYLS
ncbi:BRCA1-associated protein [Echinococcus granulosus]|uniref:BRCA1-associated protein n=1 Tax=Echinococcus granulosus TaxID=6210 RepID=W6U6J2_ECHGR|nr:BRCA1-associated protein [Echinococcus granulosus]EUB56858.1 BRCA1-associated protein [Echinococcus granulosus]